MYGEMKIQLFRKIDEKQHLHPEIEVITVIDGTADVTVREKTFRLNKEDILLVNSGVAHTVVSGEESVSCMVRYPLSLVSGLVKNGNCIFAFNTVADPQGDYREIHTVFHKLIFAYLHQDHKTDSLLLSLLFRLLDCIVERYQISDSMAAMKENEEDIRLQKIFGYVNANYQTGLSLTEIAQQFYVSASTLSRFFKRQTGIYFSEYVNQVRCRRASQDLIYSEKSITRLAADCGFSSSSALNKTFREIYGMSPSDYRRAYQQQAKDPGEEQQWIAEIRKNLTGKIPDYNLHTEPAESDRCVSADVRGGQPFQKKWNKAVNIGAMYGLTMANIQFHTLELVRQIGFRHVRIWSIFSEKMMLTDGVHIGNYNYAMTDMVLDFLVQNKIYPFLDFGRRPSVINKSEVQPVFLGEEYIHFQSRRAWEAVFADFVHHVVNRYGREEVGHWCLDITFDPFHLNLSQYYEDDGYDWMNVYQFAYRTVKDACPEALVGGPGCSPGWKNEVVRDFLIRSREDHMEPDFVSCLIFPYENRDGEDDTVRYRSTREDCELDEVQQMREIMESAGLGNCSLYVTEWNNSISMRNFLNDSCFRAAYVVKKIVDMWDWADLIGPWIGSDWVTGYYDTRGVANGGNGYLTKDSIRKPAFFALQFLNHLGDILIMKNEFCILTRTGEDFYLLCYNFKNYAVNYYIGNETLDKPGKIRGIFENETPVQVSVTLEHLAEDALYMIKRRTVNQEHGSLLDVWEKFQYDTELSEEDTRYLRESCFPEMSLERRHSAGGKLTIQRTLLPHEISIYHIYEKERNN